MGTSRTGTRTRPSQMVRKTGMGVPRKTGAPCTPTPTPLSSDTGRASSNENASGQASPHLHDQRRSASQEDRRTRREGASHASPALASSESLAAPTRTLPHLRRAESAPETLSVTVVHPSPRFLYPSVSFVLAPSVRPQPYRSPTTGFVRITPSPASRLRAVARIQSRGVVEHLSL
ncbi:hypothetical protein FB451DRAFT_1294811 [Mycena latifolia]|nr:hypothetical protein FB451DRAFT_1294811 [Mycena latifolia]